MSIPVSFGSFGDIVTLVQLVSQLCVALSDVTDAPAEIDALAADLKGYMLVLTMAEDFLLRRDSSFDPRTRDVIEGALRRCKNTLLAIQRHVDVFVARLQPGAGRNILSAYVTAVRWRLFRSRKEVAALHARLDKQLSFVQLCLGVSHSHDQRALQSMAQRNSVVAEEILLFVHARAPQIQTTASMFQLYDYETGTAYQAFEVLPLRMLKAYLEPLMQLMGSQFARLDSLDYHIRVDSWDPSPGVSLARPYNLRKGISKGLVTLHPVVQWDFSTIVVFHCNIVTSCSGEQRAIIGTPPSDENRAVSRLLSAVLQGGFSSLEDEEMYAAAKRRARYIENMIEAYHRIRCLAHMLLYVSSAPSNIRLDFFSRFERYPDLTSLRESSVISHWEEIMRLWITTTQPEPKSRWIQICRHGLDELADLLHQAPKIPDDILTNGERNHILNRTTNIRFCTPSMRNGAFTAILHLFARREMTINKAAE